MVQNQFVLNGIDGTTGRYLVPPMSIAEAAAVVTDRRVSDPLANGPVVKFMEWLASLAGRPHLGLPHDVNPADVSRAGWGIVFQADEAAEVREALAPLIEHRKARVAEGRCHVLRHGGGLDARAWLTKQHVAAGNVNPLKVPYYLLVVGDPERIPFRFTQELGLEYAVGRLHFETAGEYRRYAESVIEYETAEGVPNTREVAYFAPRHEGDPATELSARSLVTPLAYGEAEPGGLSVAQQHGFGTRCFIGADATKDRLRNLFGRDAGPTPALLFTASHGIGWPLGHEKQRTHTGALLCQDWPATATPAPGHYFAADDVDGGMRPSGMISIHFACYSGGIPEHDRFVHEPGRPPRRIAPASFVTALPKALLAHPAGGMLASVTHVDRAWGHSIEPRDAGPQLTPFRNLVARVLLGQPVGYAMRDINERFAVLGAALSRKLEDGIYGRPHPEHEIVADWIERNDAEGYQILGDPAVALRVDQMH